MKKIRLCAFTLIVAILTLSFTTTATVAATGETDDLPVLWEYYGDDTVVTIPDYADIVMPGTFSGSDTQTVIINHDVILCGNAFYGAYQLKDIYFYADNVTHLYDLHSGKPCKHGELICLDESCMHRYEAPVYTTILCGTYSKPERYASSTITIHGHKGSTAERFVELVNSNPTLFNCPQTIVFQVIEDEPKEDDTGDNVQDTKPTEPDIEEDVETPEEPPQDTPEEAPQEPPVTDNDTEEGTDEGDTEEAPEEPSKPQKGEVHLKGTPGTELYIDNFNGITYPRNVYMNIGSYYIIELGNVPEGYTYQIQEVYSNLYTLNAQTGELTALRSGMTTMKIRLNYPDGRYANLSCKIYIEGD